MQILGLFLTHLY